MVRVRNKHYIDHSPRKYIHKKANGYRHTKTEDERQLRKNIAATHKDLRERFGKAKQKRLTGKKKLYR
jgi:hypothetical protein